MKTPLLLRICLLAVGTLLASQLPAGAQFLSKKKVEMTPEIEKAFFDHFKGALYLEQKELSADFKALFPDTQIYDIWKRDENSAAANGAVKSLNKEGNFTSSSGMNLTAIVTGKDVLVLSGTDDIVRHLLGKLSQPLKDKDAVTKVLNSLSSVNDDIKAAEVIQKGTTYYIYNGKSFFDDKSGWIVETDASGKPVRAGYEMKLKVP